MNELDKRARIHAKPQQRSLVYGTGELMKLLNPNTPDSPHGLVWPYTPTISYQRSVDYQSYDLTHVNQEPYAYAKTQALRFSVSGDFSVQNSWEARYWIACFHFLETVTKMQFGKKSKSIGAPPPVLLFSAYGELMFNRLPVIVENFNITLDDNSDYIKTEVANKSNFNNVSASFKVEGTKSSGSDVAWVPSKSNITVSLIHQNTPDEWVNTFSWQKFRDGDLIKRKGWK